MHEVSLMENTLELVLNYAQKEGAKEIHWIKLKVGALSGVIPEALAFAFDVVIQGTIAQNAHLEIETVPVIVHCEKCQLDFTPSDFIYDCPRCQQLCYEIRQGKELELVSMEIA
ncbi:hydrogenase maturation nickel metallochaperone HypA [Oscillatoria salina]|uniref:hydrogenase maturation nickel metallochaperone HypA n=1 Tax=Oscillatoria salina TaxID=331517 RepID=UPI0013BAE8B2|nr:hydrogenase maturation nickel metallochaperone HypA [Oscillatoria salina]MBZ8181091.1 hydrogenase maturation nickel metallochaperone HypA [Oscillatoria salina IIICB1]NET90851.1 hydrogenase maturation nickel metallochaperone HypA [Kamptonema sp. SIO1D9]